MVKFLDYKNQQHVRGAKVKAAAEKLKQSSEAVR